MRYGDEIQKSWKPLLNTIFVLRSSSECLAQYETGRLSGLDSVRISSNNNQSPGSERSHLFKYIIVINFLRLFIILLRNRNLILSHHEHIRPQLFNEIETNHITLMTPEKQFTGQKLLQFAELGVGFQFITVFI